MNFWFRKHKSHRELIVVSIENAALSQSCVSPKTADQKALRIGIDLF